MCFLQELVCAALATTFVSFLSNFIDFTWFSGKNSDRLLGSPSQMPISNCTQSRTENNRDILAETFKKRPNYHRNHAKWLVLDPNCPSLKSAWKLCSKRKTLFVRENSLCFARKFLSSKRIQNAKVLNIWSWNLLKSLSAPKLRIKSFR